MEFENAEIEFGIRKVVDDIGKLNRVSSATDVSGSFKKFASERFREEFKLAHLVRTEDARFAAPCKLFEQLPTESSFPSGGSRADYIKPRTEELKLVEIIETGKAVGVSFHFFDGGIEIVGKEIREGSFF